MSSEPDTALTLHLRSRTKNGEPSTSTVRWAPKKTAFIVCDMWDDHWCKSAARRRGRAGRADERGRSRRPASGACFIIHAPST